MQSRNYITKISDNIGRSFIFCPPPQLLSDVDFARQQVMAHVMGSLLPTRKTGSGLASGFSQPCSGCCRHYGGVNQQIDTLSVHLSLPLLLGTSSTKTAAQIIVQLKPYSVGCYSFQCILGEKKNTEKQYLSCNLMKLGKEQLTITKKTKWLR